MTIHGWYITKHTLGWKMIVGREIYECTKFMNTWSFTIPFKIVSACSKVFIKCIICFGELKEVSSF